MLAPHEPAPGQSKRLLYRDGFVAVAAVARAAAAAALHYGARPARLPRVGVRLVVAILLVANLCVAALAVAVQTTAPHEAAPLDVDHDRSVLEQGAVCADADRGRAELDHHVRRVVVVVAV